MTVQLIPGFQADFQLSASATATVPAGTLGNRRAMFLISSKQSGGANALASLSWGGVAATVIPGAVLNYFASVSNQASIWEIDEAALATIPGGAQVITGTCGSTGDETQVYGTLVVLEDCYQGDVISASTIAVATGQGTPDTGVISAAFGSITAGMLMLAAHMCSSAFQGFVFSGDGGHAVLGSSDRNAGSVLRAAASSAVAADTAETLSARNNFQDSSNPSVIVAIAIASAAGAPAATSPSGRRKFQRLFNQLFAFRR